MHFGRLLHFCKPSQHSALLEKTESILFGISFLGALLATLWIIWGYEFPAMVDFPPFAAGLHAMHEFLFLESGQLRQIYTIDFLQPYLIPFLVGAVLTEYFDSVTAAKLLLTFSAVAGPLACCHLASRAGADRWWGLLAFATFFGYAFVWGMISQLVAVPIAFLFLAYCLDAEKEPTMQSAENILFCGLLLIFSHGLVALYAIGAGGILLVFRRPRTLSAGVPFLSIVLLTIVECCMLLQAVSGLKLTYAPSVQWYQWYSRILGFLSSVFSIESDLPGAVVGILFFVVVLHANKCTYVKSWNRRIVFILFIACILCAPTMFDLKNILYRASCLTAAMAILGFANPVSAWRRFSFRVAIIVVISWQIQENYSRAVAMDRSMEPFRILLNQMEPSQSVMSVCYSCDLPGINRPVLFNIGCWYGAFGSGLPAYYFPNTSPWPIRYRDDFSDRNVRNWTGWLPRGASFEFKKFHRVKYYIFHGDSSDLGRVSKAATGFAHLVAKEGDWALYENVNPEASLLPHV